MKKSIFRACLILAVCVAASSAYATNVTINGTTSIGSLGFTPSNKVIVAVKAAATGYTTESLHMSGSRVFGTDSVKSIIYWKDVTINGTTPTDAAASFDTLTAPAASGTAGTPDFSTAANGWTSM